MLKEALKQALGPTVGWSIRESTWVFLLFCFPTLLLLEGLPFGIEAPIYLSLVSLCQFAILAAASVSRAGDIFYHEISRGGIFAGALWCEGGGAVQPLFWSFIGIPTKCYEAGQHTSVDCSVIIGQDMAMCGSLSQLVGTGPYKNWSAFLSQFLEPHFRTTWHFPLFNAWQYFLIFEWDTPTGVLEYPSILTWQVAYRRCTWVLPPLFVNQSFSFYGLRTEISSPILLYTELNWQSLPSSPLERMPK